MDTMTKPSVRRYVSIGLLALILLTGVLLLTAKLPPADDAAGYYTKVSVWAAAAAVADGFSSASLMGSGIVLLVLVVAAFCISGILSAALRRASLLTPCTVSLIADGIILGAGGAMGLSAGGIALAVFGLLLSLAGIAYHILCASADRKAGLSPTGGASGEEELARGRHGRLMMAILAGASFLSAATVLFTPFVSYTPTKGRFPEDVSVTPLDALRTGSRDVTAFAAFTVCFILLAASLVRLVQLLCRLSAPAVQVARRARGVVLGNLGLTGVYFLAGVILTFVMNMNGKVYYPGGSLPLTLTAVLAVLTACVQGVCFAEPNTAHGETGRAWQYVLLGFKVIFSVLACSTLLTNLITVRYTGSFGTFIRRINGVRLLQTYGPLGKAYHQMAFLVMLLLSLTVVFLLVSVSAFLGRSRFFSRLCVAGIATDMAAVLLVGVSCKYFEVVQGLNEELIFMLLPDQLTPYLPQVTYKLSSDAIYPMLIGVLLLGVLLILSPMSRDERERARTEGRGTRAAAGKTVGAPDTEKPDFDPCPAFTELDGRRSRLSADADVRREQAFPSPTLESVVRFVVSYARDSRLHLSYREEEIADFIAGLGASRLTILQGMSGTGKTSLPKIVCEALMGNCEIVEVESSWRDKNELLGYYNEFSQTYTPRKFTQALYRACLDPDTVTLIVLDEMNLSRIEYYFSDFLSLMENEEDRRELKLLNTPLYCVSDHELRPYRGLIDGHTIRIPRNVWFVGTANRDESTFGISDKVYDRAHTMNFRHRAARIEHYGAVQAPRYLSCPILLSLLGQARDSFPFDVETNGTVRRVEELLAPYNVSFGNRVARQMEDYVRIYCACFPSPASRLNEALENILLSEVVAKLENRNVEDREALAAEFDGLGLHRCADFVRGLNEEFL